MADVKISALPVAASVALTDYIPCVVPGLTTKSATFTVVRTALLPITLSGAEVTGTLTVGKGGTGITSLAAGMATWWGSGTSADLATAMTDETGTGALVFGTAPLFKTTINLNNPGNTFKYVVTPAAIAADRILNLPLMTGTDTVALLALAQTFTNKTLTSPIINGQVQGPAVAIAALAIDWSLGTVFTKTLSAGANTFTFSNQASGMSITVRVTGAASTLTWPTVKWAAGAAPTQTASGTDVYTFVHDGTSVHGSVVQAMA